MVVVVTGKAPCGPPPPPAEDPPADDEPDRPEVDAAAVVVAAPAAEFELAVWPAMRCRTMKVSDSTNCPVT
jgi:hypothetical protein